MSSFSLAQTGWRADWRRVARRWCSGVLLHELAEEWGVSVPAAAYRLRQLRIQYGEEHFPLRHHSSESHRLRRDLAVARDRAADLERHVAELEDHVAELERRVRQIAGRPCFVCEGSGVLLLALTEGEGVAGGR